VRTFSYTAYSKDGQRRNGVIVAEDASAASEKLRGEGLFPEDITDRVGASGSLRRRGSRLDADLQAVFARQMAVLLSAGLPVDAALEVVRSSGASNKMELVAARTHALVLDGAPLSEALEKAGSGFPGYVTSAIRAGEASRDVSKIYSAKHDRCCYRRSFQKIAKGSSG
jgi:general secretion pathway protein F